MVDVDGAIAGVINYLAWPTAEDENPLTIVNAGTAGATYNGTAIANRYSLLSTGATSFANTATSDNVSIPHGAAINNFSTATFEWVFEVTAASPDGVYILGKEAIFRIMYDTDYGALSITRIGDAWAHQRSYVAYGCGFSVSNWYYVQISWDCTTYANVPVVKINNVSKSVTDVGSTTVSAWIDDSAENVILWNVYAGAGTQKVAAFRWHNVILSDAELISNYNLTKWRIPSEVTVHMTVPDVVADEGTVKPSLGVNMPICGTVADEGTVTPSVVDAKYVSLTARTATTGVSKISSVGISIGLYPPLDSITTTVTPSTIITPSKPVHKTVNMPLTDVVADEGTVTPSIISNPSVTLTARNTVADEGTVTPSISFPYNTVPMSCPGCVADECRINTPLVAEELVDTGVTPVYLPVSALNTFTNTENEIITLRNTGTTDTYTVTVGPTEYTPTIVADRCAFLGPFDIVTYGTKPEISYDSLTNLEIVILKII